MSLTHNYHLKHCFTSMQKKTIMHNMWLYTSIPFRDIEILIRIDLSYKDRSVCDICIKQKPKTIILMSFHGVSIVAMITIMYSYIKSHVIYKNQKVIIILMITIETVACWGRIRYPLVLKCHLIFNKIFLHLSATTSCQNAHVSCYFQSTCVTMG